MLGEKNGWRGYFLTAIIAIIIPLVAGAVGYGKLSQKVDTHLNQNYQSETALKAFGTLNAHNAKLEALIKALEKEVNRLAKIDNG